MFICLDSRESKLYGSKMISDQYELTNTKK